MQDKPNMTLSIGELKSAQCVSAQTGIVTCSMGLIFLHKKYLDFFFQSKPLKCCFKVPRVLPFIFKKRWQIGIQEKNVHRTKVEINVETSHELSMESPCWNACDQDKHNSGAICHFRGKQHIHEVLQAQQGKNAPLLALTQAHGSRKSQQCDSADACTSYKLSKMAPCMWLHNHPVVMKSDLVCV